MLSKSQRYGSYAMKICQFAHKTLAFCGASGQIGNVAAEIGAKTDEPGNAAAELGAKTDEPGNVDRAGGKSRGN